jgi:hypothetical protein
MLMCEVNEGNVQCVMNRCCASVLVLKSVSAITQIHNSHDAQETAALRDFDPFEVGYGSFASVERCPRHVCFTRLRPYWPQCRESTRCATTSREQVHKNSRSLEFEFFVCSAPTAHVHWWRKFLMDILNTDCPRGP